MNADKQKNLILKFVGLGMLLLGMLLDVIVTNGAGGDYFTENLIMTIATIIAIVVTVLNYFMISVIIAALATVVFAGYKIYTMMAGVGEFGFASFLWIVIPGLCTVGMYLFNKSYSSLTIENAVLKQQIQELVMIDPVTGLYNLRSMFMDIQTQISYAERNDCPLTLMILRLRYPAEMRKVLKKDQYEKVLKQLSLLVMDSVRLEDRVYSIDNMGGFGVILTCDKAGTGIVEKRVREKLEDPKWFDGISSKAKIRAEVKIGYVQYEKSKYNRDANALKEDVEEEVDYDL